MDIFLVDGTAPFSISIMVFVGLFAVEVLLLVFGASLSGTVDDMLPDFSVDSGDFSVGKALSFVGFGKVPTLLVIMVFLVSFGLIGIGLQAAVSSVFGGYAPTWGAVSAAMLPSLAVTGRASALLARVLPNVQTSAVSEASFVGRGATVTYGTASFTLPAAAEVVDHHGKLHHVQVKSDADGEILLEGQVVFITRIEDGFYHASRDPHINRTANEKA